MMPARGTATVPAPAEVGEAAALHERVARLPVLPAVVRTLSALDPDADDYFDQALRMAHADPGFAARLLQLANSAAQRAARPVSSIHLALMRVGARAAVDLQLTAALTQVFQPRRPWQRELWAHSVFAACLMRRLAPLVADARLDAGEAYMAGLLHDLGRFLLFDEPSPGACDAGEPDWSRPGLVANAQQAGAAQRHAELGYLALTRWGVPEPIAQAARDHHLVADHRQVGSLTALLRDVDGLANTLARGAHDWFDKPEAHVEQVLGGTMAGRYRGDLSVRRVALRTAAMEAQALLDAIGLGTPCYCAAA